MMQNNSENLPNHGNQHGAGVIQDECPTPMMDIDTNQFQLNQENEKQMLRLIQQYLTDHGYQDVALSLQSKSKVMMEDDSMNTFRECVIQGDFNQARQIIRNRLIPNDQLKRIEYMLYEQEYLELMDKGSKLEAILLLQKELMPRCQDQEGKNRLFFLSQLILCKQEGKISTELRDVAKWKGPGYEGRNEMLFRLQNVMPPSEMLPPMRLEKLVKQSLAYQTYNCKYHNVNGANTEFSFLEDHQCQKQLMIPTKCIGVLTKHKDEVWQVKWSPNGTRLATVGKDQIIYIWQLTKLVPKKDSQMLNGNSPSRWRYKVKLTHEIKGHSKQINALAWSPYEDGKYILTTSNDGTAKIWETQKSLRLISDVQRHQDAVTCGAFLPTNQDKVRFITGGVDKLIILWELVEKDSGQFDHREIGRIESRNYLDIAINSQRFVLMGQSHFQVFTLPTGSSDFNQCFEDPELGFEQELTDTVTSISLSKDGRLLLANVSLKAPRLELYDLHPVSQKPIKRADLIRRYKGGHEQSMFVLRCAFGGSQDQFVLVGSEDASISIWSRDRGELINRISGAGGHSQVVNAVSWCPTESMIFASTSDDQSVRIWGTQSSGPCEIVQDSKDIKRLDVLRIGQNGYASRSPEVQVESHNDDEDIDEEEEDDDSDYDEEMANEEEAMADEEEEEYHPRSAILQITRMQSRQVNDEDEDDENDSDWVEGSQQ